MFFQTYAFLRSFTKACLNFVYTVIKHDLISAFHTAAGVLPAGRQCAFARQEEGEGLSCLEFV